MKKNKKLLIIIAIIVVILAIVCCLLFKKKPTDNPTTDPTNNPTDNPNQEVEEKLVDGSLTEVQDLSIIKGELDSYCYNNRITEDFTNSKVFIIYINEEPQYITVKYSYKKGEACNIEKGLRASISINNVLISTNQYAYNRVAKFDDHYLWLEKGTEETGYNVALINTDQKVVRNINYKSTYGEFSIKKNEKGEVRKIAFYCDSNVKEYPGVFLMTYDYKDGEFSNKYKKDALLAYKGIDKYQCID